VLRIDPNTGVKTIVAPHLRAVAIAAGPNGRAFVSNGWDRVTPLPAAGRPSLSFPGRTKRAPPSRPTRLLYRRGTLWVVVGATRSVVAINQYTIDLGITPYAHIALGRTPLDIASGAGSVWIANRGDGTISQINPASERITRTIHIGYRLAGLAVGAGAVWATTRRIRATAAATGLLAFDDRGQIYTSRPDGSERTQLTHARGPTQDVKPAWSPDGRRIVFVRGRLEGQSSFKPFALYVMNADGTRQRRIPHTNDQGGVAPAWSPDGTKIAFSAGSPGHIYTIEPDGTRRTRVAGVPANSSDVAWSPDGTQIGFDSNAHRRNDYIFNVYTIQADGTRLRRLTHVPSQYVEWTPDGRRIIFNRYTSSGRFLGEFIAPASGSPAIRLLPPTHHYNRYGPFGPSVVSWSPDGEAITVSGLTPGASPPAIYLANADGTGLTFVTRGNDANWSPVPS
jgi:hypothetical protein